jgi:hypothetical protein
MPKRTPEAERVVLAALECGMSKTAAAQRAGISRITLGRWCRSDPAFSKRVERAVQIGRRFLREALKNAPLSTRQLLNRLGTQRNAR